MVDVDESRGACLTEAPSLIGGPNFVCVHVGFARTDRNRDPFCRSLNRFDQPSLCDRDVGLVHVGYSECRDGVPEVIEDRAAYILNTEGYLTWGAIVTSFGDSPKLFADDIRRTGVWVLSHRLDEFFLTVWALES
jgi:hypothetical protein